MKALNQKDAIHYIAERKEFTASALEGRAYNVGTGRLDNEETARYNEDLKTTSFWVYSYSTPIAWYSYATGWYVVEQKFSVTTSKHSNFVRRAIAESLQGVN